MTSEQLIQQANDAETGTDFCAAMIGLRARLREVMSAWEGVKGHPAVMVEDPDEFAALRRAIEGTS